MVIEIEHDCTCKWRVSGGGGGGGGGIVPYRSIICSQSIKNTHRDLNSIPQTPSDTVPDLFRVFFFYAARAYLSPIDSRSAANYFISFQYSHSSQSLLVRPSVRPSPRRPPASLSPHAPDPIKCVTYMCCWMCERRRRVRGPRALHKFTQLDVCADNLCAFRI